MGASISSGISGLGPSAWLFAVVAAAMVAFNILVLLQFFPRKDRKTPNLSRAALVGYVLVSSVSFWLTILYDVLTGGGALGATAILFGVQIMMLAPFVWAFITILRGETYFVRPQGWGWPSFLAATILLNELLMGSIFTAIVSGISTLVPGGAWSLATAFSLSVLSPWFFWAMFANMVALLFWVRVPSVERTALLGLAATALVGPWVVSDPVPSAAAMAVLMAATLLVALTQARARPSQAVSGSRVLLAVTVGFIAMSLGILVSVVSSSAPWALLPFTLTTFAVMGAETVFLARRILQVLVDERETTELSSVPSAPAAAPD